MIINNNDLGLSIERGKVNIIRWGTIFCLDRIIELVKLYNIPYTICNFKKDITNHLKNLKKEQIKNGIILIYCQDKIHYNPKDLKFEVLFDDLNIIKISHVKVHINSKGPDEYIINRKRYNLEYIKSVIDTKSRTNKINKILNKKPNQ